MKPMAWSVRGSSIKYVHSDLVNLEREGSPVYTIPNFILYPLPLVREYEYGFLKMWQRYILGITINQRTANNVTK